MPYVPEGMSIPDTLQGKIRGKVPGVSFLN